MLKVLKNSRGMTLVEIMIVLAIIGAIAAVLGKQIIGTLDKSRVKETKIMMSNISQAIQMYYSDCGRMPPNLKALVTAPGDDECGSWGPDAYMKKDPKDAWKNEFIYELNGNEFTLKSLGSDRREGGSGYAKDISSED